MRDIPFGRPMIGEEEKKAVLEVLSTPVLTHGPRVKEFEKAFSAFTGAPHSIATSSCTASLHLSYLHLGIGPGDEVIVPAQTHTATAHAVEYTGARAVFADVDRASGNIDLDHAESLITDRTRAICVVHFLGVPVDMKQVLAIASKRSLFVVEDCALALGTTLDGVHAGLHGDTGCFSFYPVKHITTAEGGMSIARDETIANNVSQLRAFGIDRNVVSERKVPGMYSVEKLGFNYRLNEIGAAIGAQQMKRLSGILAARRRNFKKLAGMLSEMSEIEVLGVSGFRGESSCYALGAILKEPIHERRFEIVEYLKTRGIGTSTYYPSPVPLMPYYRNRYHAEEGDYPIACRISYQSITLPVGPHLREGDIEYIVASLKDAIAGVK